jgi:hypothetical protein
MKVVRVFEPTSSSNRSGSNVPRVLAVPVQTRPPGERVVWGPEPFEPAGRAPSKRSNKNRSGRRGLKAYRGSKWVSAVGGMKDTVRAIYAPADYEMCRVVPFDTGMRDGEPFRSPNLYSSDKQ